MTNPANVFPFRKQLVQPRIRLLCLPYAGGAASLYRSWPARLAPGIDVCPVELPGRGLRFAEPMARDMASLCDALIPAIEPLLDGTPVALFGHSMGARIAFELAHRLDGRLTRLFASGAPAPGVRLRYGATGDPRPTAQLSDAELTQRLRNLGGTPPEILEHRELMERVIPIVRGDFVLVEQYQVDPSIRVSCPITVFAGIHDPGAAPGAAAAWQLRTTSSCRIVELDAGHFFLDTHRDLLLREILRELAPRLG